MLSADELAPVVLFAFNRPGHTRQTVEALLRNELAGESELFVYCDGPRYENDRAAVHEVREYIRATRGFKKITVRERKANCGLARSIVHGVTEVVEEYGRVIVLEDDLVSSPHFLTFMNQGLTRFKAESCVAAVHGYVPPINRKESDIFLLRYVDCWGWATWSRSWRLFDENGSKLLNQLRARSLERMFNINDSYDYIAMLDDQISGKNDSWAIRWYASTFLRGMFGVFPGRSLIQHIGWDRGTHSCDTANSMHSLMTDGPIPIGQCDIREDVEARVQLEAFFRTLNPGLLSRFRHQLDAVMKRLQQRVSRLGKMR